jgi:hypothetical protein
MVELVAVTCTSSSTIAVKSRCTPSTSIKRADAFSAIANYSKVLVDAIPVL